MGNKPTQMFWNDVPYNLRDRIVNEYITKYRVSIETKYRFTTNAWHHYKDEATGRHHIIAITEIMYCVLRTLKSQQSFYPEARFDRNFIEFHLIISGRSSDIIPSEVIPTHIAQSVMRTAIEKGDTCPILLTPLTEETAVLTSCGHLFSKEGLTSWFTSKPLEHNCPTCSKHVTKIHSLSSP